METEFVARPTAEDEAVQARLPFHLWNLDTATWRASRRLAREWSNGGTIREYVRQQVESGL